MISSHTFFSHKRWILLFLCFFTAMGSLAAQDEASALFREAETRFRKGDYLFALQRYDELIRQYPVSEYVADAQFRRAVILYRTGKAEEALSLFERVEKRYASTRFRRYIPFWKGVALFTLDRFEPAASALADYLASSPDQLQAEAGRYLALSYQKLGDTDKAAEAAVASLGKLTSDDGAFPYTLSLALSLLLEAGKVDQALALLQPVDPGLFSVDWQQRLGFFKAEALYRSGEEEESIPWYVSSLDAPADTSAPAYERLYSIYRKLGMEEEQNELFDRAMIALASRPEMLNRFLLQAGIEQFHEGSRELAESNLRRILRTSGNADRLDLASLYLARIRVDQGDREDAIRILQEREKDSESLDQELLFTLALFLSDAEQWDAATRRLDTFLGRYPDSPHRDQAEYLRAYCEYRLGHLSRSLNLVDNIFRSGYAGENTRSLLRLKARIHMGLRDYRSSIESLKEYIPLAPDDLEARLDLLRLYYQVREYRQVISDAPALLKEYQEKNRSIEYLLGLSLVAVKEYDQALDVFDRMLSRKIDDDITPYARFYAGWSAYRTGAYSRAVEFFRAVYTDNPDHELSARSRYLSGWALYTLGSYKDAALAFGEYSRQMSGSEAEKGLFMYAKSYAAAGDVGRASSGFQELSGKKSSAYADDALYEYAQMMQNNGNDEEAIRSYYQLWLQFKSSPYAGDALYNRGELLFLSGQYRKAGEAFYFYRTRFPRGALVDASLHYGALAARKEAAPFQAVLLWEKLIDEHPKSAFYPEALQGCAELYRQAGEYRKSIAMYTRLLDFYPDIAKEAHAAREIETLGKMLQGTGSREAALQVTIEQESTGTKKGVDAMVELGRLYYDRYDRQEEKALSLLEKVVAEKDRFPAPAAEAYYLLGEMAAEKGEAKKAVEHFLDAAALGGEGDTSARSLYRAAEVAADAGDHDLAQTMVRQIELSFPDSEWTLRGRELLEERR
ncbi:tetratricopeptide repeat protein [Sediminispirochaeta bajacaliforniensis]|uniref:tetratricopeptide repeat protein n=1 Tax=Sediminispirochaeta bajacaliforniensis TaxID=148 RepID=UPI00038013D4|nr:tetratricopeptide repeat protein [Sediminispirochaeta bajacaliforniensis]